MSYSPITKPEIASGTLIDNRYIIQQLLGQGGLGRTYLAFDSRRFKEPCVLKEFAPVGTGLDGLEKCRNLFRREAKILHHLEHPQIPRFLACFEGDHRLFLVQEFVDGKTYSTLLAERQQQGLTFTEDEVINWLKNLLPVLEYVHQHNIIHRDISPDNIMLPQGKHIPVLIDFGVGKQITGIDQTGVLERTTFVGKVSLVGKVGYAPREQISLGICSSSSDLYALGVTAIVLMTGREPSTLMNQYSLEWEWRKYTNISDAFARVLDKMLADTPQRRYQTAIETLTSLQNLGKSPTLLQTAVPNTPTTAFIPSSDRSFTSPPGENSSLPKKTRFISSTNREFSPVEEAPRISYLDASFIQRCQEHLAYHIGPMASLIIEDMLAENRHASPQQFVELLANEIPDSQAAIEFVRSLFSSNF